MFRKYIFAAVLMIAVMTAALVGQNESVKGSESALTVDAQIGTAIEDRQPVGVDSSFPPDVDTLFLWTRVMGAEDSTSVRHVWKYKGEVKFELELPVKSASWRTWSYKTILPSWTGQWTAEVIGPDGSVMATIPFMITEEAEKGDETKEEAPAEEPMQQGSIDDWRSYPEGR